MAADDNVVSALLARAGQEPGAEAFAVRVRQTRSSRSRSVTSWPTCERRPPACWASGWSRALGSASSAGPATSSPCSTSPSSLPAACMVPIYESDSADQVRWVVGNSQATAILIEDAALRKQFDAVAADLPDCKHVFVIESGGIDELRAHGQAVTARRPRPAHRGDHPRAPRHARLHLRHDRSAEGLHAHPRQPDLRGAPGGHRSAPSCSRAAARR